MSTGGHDDECVAVEEHGPNSATWWGRGVWPTCTCGYSPRDNGLLNAHWREHGFEVVDEHRQLVRRPIQ